MRKGVERRFNSGKRNVVVSINEIVDKTLGAQWFGHGKI